MSKSDVDPLVAFHWEYMWKWTQTIIVVKSDFAVSCDQMVWLRIDIHLIQNTCERKSYLFLSIRISSEFVVSCELGFKEYFLRYYWNIVESGVKHHNPNHKDCISILNVRDGVNYYLKVKHNHVECNKYKNWHCMFKYHCYTCINIFKSHVTRTPLGRW